MFKDNFNPTINELIGEFDLPVNKMLYNLSQITYKLLKKIKKSRNEFKNLLT